MAAKKFALYHQEGVAPKKFSILKENEDGTIDIGNDDKPVVTSCLLLDDPKPGSATLFVEAKAEKKKKDEEPPADPDPTK